jgi:8-oxo-dGTP pyrophosphatase MutT (NUDIX family)
VLYLDPKLAVAVVIEREGAILLGRRGPNSREPGRWSFPAGFVDRGETVEDAAIREVLEETGLRIGIGPLLGLYSRRGETVVLAVYVAASATGEPVAGDDLDRLEWFDPANPPDLAFPHDLDIVMAWRATHAADASAGRAGTKS